MNERIRKLLVEFKEVESQHRGLEVIIGMDEIEKFAELIVKECIKVAGTEMGYSHYCAMRDKLEEHFGVEE
jgi:hypothetical protein